MNAPHLSLVVLIALQILGCVFAPYAPRDPNSISPAGEIEPVPEADSNPLESPRSLFVLCTPQGRPNVDTPELRECEEHPDCRVLCTRDPERALENEEDRQMRERSNTQ